MALGGDLGHNFSAQEPPKRLPRPPKSLPKGIQKAQDVRKIVQKGFKSLPAAAKMFEGLIGL